MPTRADATGAPAGATYAGDQIAWSCAAVPVGVWPHGPTLPPTTVCVLCIGVSPRDAKPFRKVGRDHGHGAGGLRSRSVSIKTALRRLLSGDDISPTKLTMPTARLVQNRRFLLPCPRWASS